MPLDSLQNTLLHEMSDLLSAERQIAKLLQQSAKAADSEEVKQMIQAHHQETLQQAENLLQAFSALGAKAEKITCKAAAGLVEEATSTLKEEKPKGAFKDLAIMSSGLRVEHYEIAGYRSAIAVARAVGNKEVVQLLQANLKQEEATAKKLEAASAATLKSMPKDGATPVAATAAKPITAKAPVRRTAAKTK